MPPAGVSVRGRSARISWSRGTIWVASTYDRGSYDSRYMGPIRIAADPREASTAMDTLTWLRLLGAGAIGAVAWHGTFWAIPLSIFMPCLVAGQPTRLTAAGAAFAYYAGASWPVIAVARSYWPSIGAGAPLLWLAAALILSLPWILFWTRRASLRPWTMAIALVFGAVPPVCIIGWASPLVSAGVLFPNTAWLGLVATLALPGFLLNKATRGMALFTAAAGQPGLELPGQASRRPERVGSRDDPDSPGPNQRCLGRIQH